MVSTGALASCGFWGIDCLFLTQKGRPVAMLKSLDDDSHVKTRVCQYEASLNEYFKTKVGVPRIRMGSSQEIETLINEEALLFAMFLRCEKQNWKPRIANVIEFVRI